MTTKVLNYCSRISQLTMNLFCHLFTNIFHGDQTADKETVFKEFKLNNAKEMLQLKAIIL